ncbi:FMN-binding protein [bacterium]|nr:FMN-binding protein [bacterium]
MSDEKTSEPGFFRLAMTLGVAGLLSGAILASLYTVTLPRIKANRRAVLEAAILRVLPGTTTFTPMVAMETGVSEYSGPEGEEPADKSIYAGSDADGKMTGYAVPAEGPGFQEAISILYGYKADERVVTGLAVLGQRETPGLGDKIEFDPKFVASFQKLAVDPDVALVRDGRDAPNEVDAISGATISSEAVVKMMNVSLDRWKPLLSPDGETP